MFGFNIPLKEQGKDLNVKNDDIIPYCVVSLLGSFMEAHREEVIEYVAPGSACDIAERSLCSIPSRGERVLILPLKLCCQPKTSKMQKCSQIEFISKRTNKIIGGYME